jgi:hypothetical protein
MLILRNTATGEGGWVSGITTVGAVGSALLHWRRCAWREKETRMAPFAGVDFIDFDSQLNDEEKLVRQTARQFVENEVVPIIEKHSREGTFPMHLVPQLGELGFFGCGVLCRYRARW